MNCNIQPSLDLTHSWGSFVIGYIGLMKIIDRYILKKFLSTFFFCVLLLVLVIVIIDFTEKVDKFNKAGVSQKEILQYYASFIPFIAGILTPITTFIAVVYITSKMAAKTEIIAILAGGMSFTRMMWPYFIGALMIGMLSFYLNGWVIPNANKFRVNFEVTHLKKAFYFNETDIHFKVGDDLYAYLFRYNNRIDRGYKFTLEKFDGIKLHQKLTASTIAWDTATFKWQLENWQLRTFKRVELYSQSLAIFILMDLYIRQLFLCFRTLLELRCLRFKPNFFPLQQLFLLYLPLYHYSIQFLRIFICQV